METSVPSNHSIIASSTPHRPPDQQHQLVNQEAPIHKPTTANHPTNSPYPQTRTTIKPSTACSCRGQV
ncbi:hypothetical protein BO82DRAFT_197840 [Aspergillus uvarum CBS 121591]|uniref:Uncharacterized protein n=1 Tax=Aspergillus uvarum CBS 121591 TaxID=1448315 RepID=A0A319CLZ1_9EURO|nr:hypothetical protein BO82DRAFT_197840 [Aspergillus uvarum CBS 121591]PYH85011.1 hypothetical protein BO82DRAFT_197840 [Aspergillus uvarum CBS 121591]